MNHWFCSPNKLWEYPVAGVPILASPFPELRREIEGAGIGRLLPGVLDGPGLRRVVDSIDEEALLRMRSACRAHARRDHWGIYLERLLELYRRLDSAPTRVCEVEVKPAAAVLMDPMPYPAEGGAG
ncbi:MAG: glycosyltransferase family 4 protein [Phycisphaera sp.]|nr:glycosyltransferase family 4 protein [Phycisphaera sp.]